MNLFSIGTSSDSSFYSKSNRKHSKNGPKSKIHQRTSSAWKSFSVCTCGRSISSSPLPKRSDSACPSAKLQEKTESEMLAKTRTTVENSSAQYSSGDLAEVPFEVIESEDILLWGCPPPKIPRLNFEDKNRELFLSVINENTKLIPAYFKGMKFLTSGTNISLRSATSSKPPKPWTPPEDQVSVNHDYSTPDFDAPAVVRWEDWSPLGLDDIESLTEIQKFVGCNSDSRSSICEIFDVTDGQQVQALSQRPVSSQYSFQDKASSAIIQEFSSSNDCTPSQTQGGNVKIMELNHTSSVDFPAPETTSSASFTRFLFQDELFLTDNKPPPPQPFQDENKNYEYGLEDTTDDPINIFTATNDDLYQQDAINIQLFHSLPVLYATVLNIDDDECESCQTKSKEHLEHRRRRKAASVSFFDDQQLFESAKTFQIPGDDCYMSLSEMLDTCHIEEITDDVPGHSEKEIFEVYKSIPLNSSSSKVPLKLSSFMGANRPKSAPSTSISLLSFSPEDSFATKLEETTEGVAELSLTKCDESKDELVSVEKLAEGGGESKKSSGSIEVKEVFSKFYPPPTPIKSVKTCRRQRDEKFERRNEINTAVVCNLLLDTSVSAPLKLETKKRSMTAEDYLNQNEFFDSEENMVGTIVDCAKFSSAAAPESVNNADQRATTENPQDIPNCPQNSTSFNVLSPAVVTETSAIPNITAPERKINVKSAELSQPAVTASLSRESSPVTALNSATSKSSRPHKPRKSVKKKVVPKHNNEYYSTKTRVLEESPKDGNVRKRRHRHPRKKQATSSEDCTDTTRKSFKPRIWQAKECPDFSNKTKRFESTGSDDDLESSESTNYKRRKKRKKKRRTLWQRMMQYFFGCSSTRRSYDNLEDSPPTRFYGSDYKPSISLFERIIIWWRRKSHRQVVVRQDSLEMFRIKRRKWLSEMHEFCEDCRVVTKNVRQAEPGKCYHKPLQLPRARVVNSEGCVLFGEKLDNLDIVNANKTETDRKGRCRKPVKSILKNGSKPAEKPLRRSKTKKR